MYAFAKAFYPIHRSLTGPGVRQSLALIRDLVPELDIREVASGTPVFDWTVPPEWTIRAAYLVAPNGERICDIADNTLHVVGYSEPIDRVMPLAELQAHLHSLPDQPEAIPYITSYYRRNWGFCLSERQRRALEPGDYRVVIDSDLEPGHLTYGVARFPGASPETVLLSTNICHPSMGNNETSGPVVTTWLARWLRERDRRLSYEVVFVPETIGALCYLHEALERLKRHAVAGFSVTCVGDERLYSLVPSPYEDTLADRVADHVLRHKAGSYKRYSHLQRGSDERQYCAPAVRLPVVSITRSKHNDYPEYHTSLDDLGFISAAGLEGSFEVLRACLECLERNQTWTIATVGEPQLGRRGLYPTTSTKTSTQEVQVLMDFLAYCDGRNDLLAIAERIGVPAWELFDLADRLAAAGLIRA